MRIAVIGNGLIGSATGRHLAEQGHDVTVVGPSEPDDHSTHQGVFASHYDQGRLVSGFSRDPVWAVLARRSVPQYDALTSSTGIEIHRRVGRVSAFVLSERAQAGLSAWVQAEDPSGGVLRLHPPGDESWRAVAPMLDVPSTFAVLVEHGDAGFLNPRSLIRAENEMTVRAGGRVLDDRVVAIDPGAEEVTVTATSGKLTVDRAVVAAGAFANAPGLLPAPLAIRCKTETTLWADVSASTSERLAGMPVITYDVDDPEIDDIYLAPPIRYPDGVVKIKMGANTVHESWPTDTGEISEWFRRGDSERDLPALARVLRAMLPDVEFGAMSSHRCIVTYTPSRYPTIDRAPGDTSGRLVVATGGNGTSAQCADALGSLAAGLVTDRPWPADLPGDPFLATHEWDELQPRGASRAQRRAYLQDSPPAT